MKKEKRNTKKHLKRRKEDTAEGNELVGEVSKQREIRKGIRKGYRNKRKEGREQRGKVN